MTAEIVTEAVSPTQTADWQDAGPAEWEPPMPPTDLIFDDGEPLESNRHRIAINTLIDSLQYHRRERNDYFAGGNMFIYYSSAQVRNRDFKGPDFFAVLNVDGTKERQGWVVWEEGGRYPNAIIELMSPSTAAVDLGLKKDLYEQIFRTADYFVYDPFDPNSLQGWHLGTNRSYQQLAPDSRGWLWCQSLGLWLGTWDGIIQRETATWLRFYDDEENLVLLPGEAAQLQAEQERLYAQQESQRAEQESQRAEQESQRADRLAARLRELGIDPDSV